MTASVPIQFRFLTGLKRVIFREARLLGSWDADGRASAAWSELPMTAFVAADGCPAFAAEVRLDPAEAGRTFTWTVRVSTAAVADVSGIAVEVNDPERDDRVRSFVLRPPGTEPQIEEHCFTLARCLGARKAYADGRRGRPGLRFAVWAPHARRVEVVFGDPAHGYIADDGTSIDAARAPLPMTLGTDGFWHTAVLPDFAAHEGLPYMYRLVNAQGRTVYRTDLYAREQNGRGTFDPQGAPIDGRPAELDGTKGCSVVAGTDTVARDFAPPAGGGARQTETAFWAEEFTPGLPVPSRVEDLVIYELHVGALGFGRPQPGTLADAMALLPHLAELGVNAVELLPMSEFSGIGWGYGDSHLFVVESTAGTRDQYKHFVRACHRGGIAVIQDVVYNHFDPNAERAQWAYDSDAPEQNAWYWYEGRSADFAAPDGGYLDNGSTGFTPRYDEETVRQLFISSAAAWIEECHVDGLRVDLTQAMHRDNVLHADGRPVGRANRFGAKLLREWSRTLRLIKPSIMLIAEDHTGWDKVTQLPEAGGLGFDATWMAAFCHHLVGDADAAAGHARLLHSAAFGDDRPLELERFAAALRESRLGKVVYHESHDEAGNARGSMRTLPCAVNGAPLVGATRFWAEARARLTFGLACLSPGTPMFFMGEEVGAQQPYRYDSFLAHREDLAGARAGEGARLFRFYRDLIRFGRRHRAVRVQAIDIVHVDGTARVLAFRRAAGVDELLVVASFANRAYDGYAILGEPARLPDGAWRELFNSDAALYGGSNVGNLGADLPVAGGLLRLVLPAVGFVVLSKL
jgi:1,4-alpha-glucan branching enzyme